MKQHSIYQKKTYEATFDISKEDLITMASNPALIAGLLGHISILQAYDPKLNKFVAPHELTDAPSRFKVAYIFGTPDGKVSVQLGEMEGPRTYIDSVTYNGFTYDNKMKWEISFAFKEIGPERTRVTVIAKTKEDRRIFDKFLGRNQFDLADHAINSHIIPFIRLYMSRISAMRSVSIGSVDYRVIAEEEGIVSEVMTRIIRLAKESNATHAVIVLRGEGFKGKIILKDGKPENAWFKCTDGSIKTGKDAILEALSASVRGKARLYALNIDSLIENVSEQIFSDGLKNDIGI